MIEFKNVSKSYKKGTKAVDGLNLTVNNGEIFGFLGPNGAGKSTTIRMLTGILNIDEGNILIDGYDIAKDDLEAKKHFGYVSDSPDQFLNLKGIEYLNFLADIYEVNDRKERIEELTKTFGINDVLNNRIESYSHGMRQKIILCGALLHDPNNWVLDEPMTGLDPRSAFDLKEMMRKHADAGNCVFFSTHVLDVAEKICDRVGIINKGKLLFVGTMEEMKETFKEDSSLEELFLEITEV
ncbi:MAG: ABC transporter ATP-binding protein [Erysipelotrichaceae bacterium]|nr:ABC transporter ATP-binding protein [Erysipelotrichaceae bacterium]